MQTYSAMQILLIAPLSTNEYLAPSFLQTHKYIREYFCDLIQKNSDEDLSNAIDAVVLDSPVPSKRLHNDSTNKLYVSSKQHQQLLSTTIVATTRPSTLEGLSILMQDLLQEMLLRKVMETHILYVVTWGEYPLLRQVCASLELRYLSLQFPAPGSQTLNILQINAKAHIDTLLKREHFFCDNPDFEHINEQQHLPIFANVIEERWHYSRYNALPSCSPESYYQEGEKNVLILVAPQTDVPDVLSTDKGFLNLAFPQLSLWKTGRITHQIEYYLRHLAKNNCHIYFFPLSRQAMPLCKRFTKFLQKKRPHWQTKTLKKLSSWPANPIYTLLQKSDAIISVNTTAGIDALRNCIPVVFLGKGSETWQWLNPQHPLPVTELNTLGQQQRGSFRQIKTDLVLNYHWFPNHKPTLLGFSRWLYCAWEAQHQLQKAADLPTLYYQEAQASLPLQANPFIPLNGSQTSKRQRLKERIQLEKRQLRKLRRDPVQYIRDSKTWHFRLVQKFL